MMQTDEDRAFRSNDEFLMRIHEALEWAESNGIPSELLDTLIAACGVDYDKHTEDGYSR
jgi:hypothetical protein